MTIKFLENGLILNGSEWKSNPFLFSDLTNIGGGGTTPTYQDVVLSGVGSLTLTNAKANGLNYVKLFGACEQTQPANPNLFNGFIDASSSGITVNIMDDNSVRVNGSRTSAGNYTITKSTVSGMTTLPAGTYTLAVYDKPEGDYTGTQFQLLYSGSSTVRHYVDLGSETPYTTFTLDAQKTVLARVHITANTTYDNYIIKPMLVAGSTAPAEYTPALPCKTNPVGIKCNNGDIKVRNKSGLPLGYQKLEYLESTGTQYIDTDEALSCDTDDIELTFQLTDLQLGSKNNIFGARANTSSKQYTFAINSANEFYNCGFGNVNEDSTIQKDLNVHTLSVESSTGNFLLDGQTLVTRSTNSATTPTTATLFAIHATSATTIYYSYIRIFEYKRWVSGVLTQHFIPAKNSSGVYGMYDLINNVFKTNAGTGTFTVGNIIDELEIYTDGAVETVKDSLNNTATAENLLGLGTTRDVQNITTGDITRNIGVYVFDGTETMTTASFSDQRGIKVTSSTWGAVRDEIPMCNYFRGTGYDAEGYNTCFWPISGSANNFYVKTNFNNIDNFRTWLVDMYNAGTPMIVVYKKATATTESVAPQTLTTKSGNNTIEITQASINNLPLEVSYKGVVEEQQGE